MRDAAGFRSLMVRVAAQDAAQSVHGQPRFKRRGFIYLAFDSVDDYGFFIHCGGAWGRCLGVEAWLERGESEE